MCVKTIKGHFVLAGLYLITFYIENTFIALLWIADWQRWVDPFTYCSHSLSCDPNPLLLWDVSKAKKQTFFTLQIPEFDNLYLDMNGIIHQCSHPNDEDVHFRISEEKIFADIFHYLEVLFRIIKPRKVFFMAVDGVAPRAKMNQQRGRRFR